MWPEITRIPKVSQVEAIQRLQHRGIVYYVDAGLDSKDRPFLVMPLINGDDIRTASSGLEYSERIELMAEVLLAVDHAHSTNVLHRDLKPSNILVRRSDLQPVIVDYGQAYLLDDLDSKTLTTKAIGSIGYIPQEVISNPKLRSPQHDIYCPGPL